MNARTKSKRFCVHDLTVQRNNITLIDGLSFHVMSGEVLGLIGPNGAGKSTLLSCMAGIETCTSGSMEIDGTSLPTLNSMDKARRIAWVEQSGTTHWPITVERLIMLGRIPHLPGWSRPAESDRLAVESAMRHADVLFLRSRRVTQLSGGERSRVMLARALACEPTLLLADEPVATLDLKHQLQAMQVLRRFVSGNNAAVVALHDLSLAARFCDRLLLISEGRLIAIGDVAAVLNDKNIAEVYGVSIESGCGQVPWIIPKEIL